MLGFIIVMLIIGLIAGFLARAIVPGDDSMSILATIVLGIVGSFVGGLLADILFRSDAEDVGLGARRVCSARSSAPSWCS